VSVHDAITLLLLENVEDKQNVVTKCGLVAPGKKCSEFQTYWSLVRFEVPLALTMKSPCFLIHVHPVRKETGV
jgi:hypothetical protein